MRGDERVFSILGLFREFHGLPAEELKERTLNACEIYPRRDAYRSVCRDAPFGGVRSDREPGVFGVERLVLVVLRAKSVGFDPEYRSLERI